MNGELSSGIGYLIAALFLIAFGILIALVPPQFILSWDRQTGYWFYQRELKAGGSEEEAIAAAGCFYKAFGVLFAMFGVLHLLLAIGVIVSVLW